VFVKWRHASLALLDAYLNSVLVQHLCRALLFYIGQHIAYPASVLFGLCIGASHRESIYDRDRAVWKLVTSDGFAASDADLGRSHTLAVAVNALQESCPGKSAGSIPNLSEVKNVYLSGNEVFFDELRTRISAGSKALSAVQRMDLSAGRGACITEFEGGNSIQRPKRTAEVSEVAKTPIHGDFRNRTVAAGVGKFSSTLSETAFLDPCCDSLSALTKYQVEIAGGNVMGPRDHHWRKLRIIQPFFNEGRYPLIQIRARSDIA
jgi:hypothetical protein